MEGKELIKFGFENIKRSVDRTIEGLTKEELAWHRIDFIPHGTLRGYVC